MDLNDRIDDQAFRHASALLDANLPSGWGTPAYVLPRGDEYLALLNDWQRRLSKAGFLGLAWPTEYGGAGASAAQVAIFNEETAARDAPQPPNVARVLLAGPVIYAYGTENQKRRHLSRILAGEGISVSGFSEPGAAAIWPRCGPGPSLRAIASSSTARRSGLHSRIWPAGACSWGARIPLS